MLNKRVSERYSKSASNPSTLQDLQSVEWVIDQYASLVKRIALHLNSRMPSHVSVDDLMQSGMIGLIEAASKYDDTKGASFETYAGIRIRGAMIDEVRRGDWAPRSVHKNSRRVTEAIKIIENRTGRDAKDSEVAEEMRITLDEYYAILQDLSSTRLFSTSELIGAEEGVSAASDLSQHQKPQYEPERETEKGALVEDLATAIQSLPEREQLILSLYYNEELNLKEIGAIIGVSESRVSQLHSQATHRLRTRMSNWSH